MASARLKPMQRKFFDFLANHKTGDTIDRDSILAATGWKPDTFDTYNRKHKLDPFLSDTGSGLFRVLRDGTDITQADVASVFTQVSVGLLVLSPGLRAQGSRGTYDLQRELGKGAVAHVWKARSKDGNDCAVKIMNPRPDLLEPTKLENVRARFRREAKNGLSTAHPRIVRYLDMGDLRGHPFIVMDLAKESLAQALERSGPMSDGAALSVVAACLGGLEHLHAQKCVHRDIKPANILSTEDGYVLGDLGIVRWSDMNPAFTSAGTLTRASVQLGSWFYMAPEQRSSPHNATPLSDIYALGVSWYEMLTRRTPDPAEVAAKAFPPASTIAEIHGTISRMVSYMPNQRPNAAELRAIVTNLLA